MLTRKGHELAFLVLSVFPTLLCSYTLWPHLPSSLSLDWGAYVCMRCKQCPSHFEAMMGQRPEGRTPAPKGKDHHRGFHTFSKPS